jgi:hypothetical protein
MNLPDGEPEQDLNLDDLINRFLRAIKFGEQWTATTESDLEAPLSAGIEGTESAS